jgi:hypothetical protein
MPKCDFARDIKPKLGRYLQEHLSTQQQAFLCCLKDKGFDIKPTGKKKTIRIKKDGRDYGYINATVIGKHGVFGYKFKSFDHCPEEQVETIDVQFGKCYGVESGWICHWGYGDRKHKKYLTG